METQIKPMQMEKFHILSVVNIQFAVFGGCGTAQFGRQVPTFHQILLPNSSGYHFYCEDGGSKFFQKVATYLQDCTASQIVTLISWTTVFRPFQQKVE
jgi:hypothetical protein